MSFKVTNSYSRENLNYEIGKVKNIHYGDIHTKFQTLFDITNEVVPFINKEINLERIASENYCQEGDIIFADASEDLNDVGKSIEIININKEELLSGLHTLLARPKTDLFHLGFNGYLFKSPTIRKQIQKESQGTKVLSINVGRISKIDLSFPEVKEQERITALLSLLGGRIETQSKIIEQLELYFQGISDNVFSRQIGFKGASDEWELETLGNIGSTYNGLSGKTVEDFGDGKMYIQYKQIFDKSKIKLSDCGIVRVDENENQNKAKYGDIFFTISSETPNEIGMSSVLLDNVEEIYLNSFCFGFRIHSFKKMLPEFARFLFRSKEFRFSIIKLAQGSTRYNMSKREFIKLSVKIPSLEEQTKIASFMSAIDQKIETEKAILEQLQLQKKYLLQNLFV